MRMPRQPRLVRHSSVGSQVKPDFDQHQFGAGEFLEYALGEEAHQRILEGGSLQNAVFEVIGRPAGTRRRMAESGARMHADRQAVPFRSAIDRPIGPVAERPVTHHQQQHLHKARIGGAALDLGGGEFGVLRRDEYRGAKPRLAIEPFARDPIVHRLAQGRRHVGVEQRHRPMQYIGDGQARADCIERLRAQGVEFGAGWRPLCRPPIRPDGLRQVRCIARERERGFVDIALGEMFAPEIIEMRH